MLRKPVADSTSSDLRRGITAGSERHGQAPGRGTRLGLLNVRSSGSVTSFAGDVGNHRFDIEKLRASRGRSSRVAVDAILDLPGREHISIGRLARLGEFMLSGCECERLRMGEERQPMFQTTRFARLPSRHGDERCGMQPGAQRVIDRDESVRVAILGSRDGEFAVVKGIGPGDPGLFRVGDPLTVQLAGQGPGAGRTQCQIVAGETVRGVFGRVAIAASLPTHVHFGLAGLA